MGEGGRKSGTWTKWEQALFGEHHSEKKIKLQIVPVLL